jgi:rhodanese-related sulfurtransferase
VSAPDTALDSRGLPTGYPFQPEYEITPKEAAARLTAEPGKFVLLDCRNDEEVAFAPIPGAVHIPGEELSARLDEIPENAKVAVICHHGRRSLRAALLLRQNGLDDAMSVAGGIDLWSRTVDSSVRRYTRSNTVCSPL